MQIPDPDSVFRNLTLPGPDPDSTSITRGYPKLPLLKNLVIKRAEYVNICRKIDFNKDILNIISDLFFKLFKILRQIGLLLV